MPKFVWTKHYESAIQEIEDFIFLQSGDLRFVEQFLDEHDATLKFIGDKPETPPPHPQTGDRSWTTASGRYRIFYIVTPDLIYLTDIIDNRRANLKIYPGNSLPTFDVDD